MFRLTHPSFIRATSAVFKFVLRLRPRTAYAQFSVRMRPIFALAAPSRAEATGCGLQRSAFKSFCPRAFRSAFFPPNISFNPDGFAAG
jgi:hypothetical protein